MCTCMQDDPGWLLGPLAALAVLFVWRLSQRKSTQGGNSPAAHVLLLTCVLVLSGSSLAWFSGCSAPAKVGDSSNPGSPPASVSSKGGEKFADSSKPDQVQQGEGDRPQASARRPKLLDLGATKCIPCKMMAPILEELKVTHKGKLDVEFIDVWVNPNAAQAYGINLIPTQIFFSPDGKELFRHEGFFSKEEILGKWKELGYDFGAAGAAK